MNLIWKTNRVVTRLSWCRGSLSPLFLRLRDVLDLAASVKKLAEMLQQQGREIVAIFDGLDRLIRADQFWAIAEQDLRAIKGSKFR